MIICMFAVQLSVFCHWLSLFVQWHSPSPSLKLEGRIVEIVLRCAPAHFSVCDSSWVTQYDCNRNGNRAEMLAMYECVLCAPSLLLLEGVRAVFLPISLAQMFLAGCWLGSYFFSRGLRELMEKRKNWISSDETWHCGEHAQQTSFFMLWLGLISRGLWELEKGKLDFFRWHLGGRHAKLSSIWKTSELNLAIVV